MALCLGRTTRVPTDKTWCTQVVKKRMNLNQRRGPPPRTTLQIKLKTTNLKHRLPSEPSILPPCSNTPHLSKAKLKWQSHRPTLLLQQPILRIRIRNKVISAKSRPLDRAWIEFLKVVFMIKIWPDLKVQARKRWSRVIWLNSRTRSTKVCQRQSCLKSSRTRGWWLRKNQIKKSSSFRVAATPPPTLHTQVPVSSTKTYSKFQRNPRRDPYLRRRKLWRKGRGKAEINWVLSWIRLGRKDSKLSSPAANKT